MFAWIAEGWLLDWVLLPLLIFLSRIADVSIGTIRLILVARGYRLQSAFLGFCEVLIWVVVIGVVLKNLTTPATYIAYAAGFAAGNSIGIYIEEWLSLGYIGLRVITNLDATELVRALREDEQCGLTVADAEGSRGPVKILYAVMQRKHAPRVIRKVREFNPRAFYTIEDIRTLNDAFVPYGGLPARRFTLRRLSPFRKGK